MDPQVKQSIIVTVKAVALHFIGIYLINGTDSIIIANVVGATAAGIYSNYFLITSTVRTFLSQVPNGILASFGNMLVESDSEKSHDVFMKAFFAGFTLVSCSSISMYVCFNPFISIWISPKALFSMGVVLIIVVNFYVESVSDMLGTLRAGAGLYKPDSLLHIVLAALNLVISIGLAHVIGVFGVFLGTFVCYTIKDIIVLPKIVYHHIFKRSAKIYYKKIAICTGSTAIWGSITFFLSAMVAFSNPILSLAVKILICLTVPNLLLIICYHKTSEFKFCISFIANAKSKILKGK